VFALGLRQQAIVLAGRFRDPGHVLLGVVPPHAYDRMPVVLNEPRIAKRLALHIALAGPIPGRLDEGLELAPGDRELSDRERARDRDPQLGFVAFAPGLVVR